MLISASCIPPCERIPGRLRGIPNQAIGWRREGCGSRGGGGAVLTTRLANGVANFQVLIGASVRATIVDRKHRSGGGAMDEEGTIATCGCLYGAASRATVRLDLRGIAGDV